LWWRTGCITFILIFNLLQTDQAVRAGVSQTVFISSPDTSHTRGEYITVVKTDRWLAPDKGKHFMASLYSTVLIAKLSENTFGADKNQASGIAIGFTISLGITKELMDKKSSGSFFSWKDLVADLAGITAGLIIINQH
jgi:putative lipoprotein